MAKRSKGKRRRDLERKRAEIAAKIRETENELDALKTAQRLKAGDPTRVQIDAEKAKGLVGAVERLATQIRGRGVPVASDSAKLAFENIELPEPDIALLATAGYIKQPAHDRLVITSAGAKAVEQWLLSQGGLDQPLWLPTLVLRRLTEKARAEGLPQPLAEIILGALPAHGRHEILSSHIEQTPAGHHYARVRAELVMGTADALDEPTFAAEILALEGESARTLRNDWEVAGYIEKVDGEWRWKDDTRTQVYRDGLFRDHEAWQAADGETQLHSFDLPLTEFGPMIEAVRGPRPSMEELRQMPVHAGSHSFEPTWMWLRNWAESAASGETDRPEAAAVAHTLERMKGARVVTVEQEISEGLPEWETIQESWEYAAHAQPPFPMTYLDFTLPGGFAPIVGQLNDEPIHLRAALVWREAENEPLNIEPFIHLRGEQRGFALPALGTIHYTEAIHEDITHAVIPGPGSSMCPVVCVGAAFVYVGHPGWVDIPNNMRFDHEPDDLPDQVFAAQARMAIISASRALMVLNALDTAANIEMADSKPPRPERRAVDRARAKGREAHIATTVQIRPTAVDRVNGEATGNKRHYSHAHWRRGHWAYYDTTSRIGLALAKTAPEKLVDHPVKGLCRKVYRRPTIVGRKDEHGAEREPVAKSYIWRD